MYYAMDSHRNRKLKKLRFPSIETAFMFAKTKAKKTPFVRWGSPSVGGSFGLAKVYGNAQIGG